MSLTNYNPTVNIVMTYKPEVMQEFVASFDGGSGNFEAFYNNHAPTNDIVDQESEQDTFIFSNGRNSNFLALKHSFIGEGEGTNLEIELMDPQGIFEKSIYGVSLKGSIPANFDPYQMHINRLRSEIINIKGEPTWQQAQADWDARRPLPPARTSDFSEKARKVFQYYNKDVQKLERDLATLEGTGAGIGGAIDYEKKKLEMLNKIIGTYRTQMQRPVYISYGIGNNLDDWSPPQCYGIVKMIEYKFNSGGVRTLKLTFHPERLHPNLTNTIGLKPFGPLLTTGLLLRGQSNRLFNKDAAKEQSTALSKIINLKYKDSDIKQKHIAEATKICNSYIEPQDLPSLHYPIKQAITNFIKNGTSKESVYVLLPNLDHYLANYWAVTAHGIEPSIPLALGNGKLGNVSPKLRAMWVKYETFKAIMHKLGFTVTESARYNQPHIDLHLNPVGAMYNYNIEECSAAEDIEEWWNSREIKLSMECDFEKATGFLDKLDQVATNIQTAISDSQTFGDIDLKEGITEFPIGYTFDYIVGDTGAAEPKLETDLKMIRLMQDAGLVNPLNNDSFDPVLFWGDQTLITDFLQGGKLEKLAGSDLVDPTSPQGQLEARDVITGTMAKVLNPLDIIQGLNYDYLKSVFDYTIPVQSMGAFGSYTADADDSSLLDDTNVAPGSVAELKKNYPLKGSRLPVFTFGSKNPNVLDVNIDINGWYTAFLQSPIKPRNYPVNSVRGIVTPDNLSMWETIKNQLESWVKSMTPEAIESGAPPPAFVDYVSPYYDENSGWIVESDADDPVQMSTLHNFDTLTSLTKGLNLGDRGEGEFTDLRETTFEKKEEYSRFMWSLFRQIYASITNHEIGMERLSLSPVPNAAATNNLASFANKVASFTLTGSIKTTPLFNMSTARRAFNRPCLLLCVEPTITPGPHNKENPSPTRTWFSGYYNILGYKHTINGSNAFSEFTIVRSATRGAPLLEGEDN